MLLGAYFWTESHDPAYFTNWQQEYPRGDADNHDCYKNRDCVAILRDLGWADYDCHQEEVDGHSYPLHALCQL